ncbi:MAG: hypothetical protein C4533_05185 [Candidatus Omnitrophota bacterium]|jgi:hypothetical protein|nr:MAG: hypothetical protein C4533_05185 [Candidatus Omnitrophota bacterium]
MEENKEVRKIPDLNHEAANQLNGVCAVSGYLLDIIKDRTDLPGNLKDEFTKGLKIIETKAQEAAGELNKIKETLQSRNQYL